MTCTRCGLCLESCPTYTLWGTEPDSPRGRIALIEDALGPGGQVTPEMAVHVDRCLGCMACMSVCPEEVPFADLLASARSAIEQSGQRPRAERLRRRVALATVPRAGHASAAARHTDFPHYTPAKDTARGRVGLLLGCTQRAAHPKIHAATLDVLSAEGYEVIAPRLPDCCGALERQAGQSTHGLHRAQLTIDAFAAVGGIDHVISSAGTCGAALKDYGRLLGTPEARAFSSLVLDVHELLTRAPLRSRLGSLALRIAYHDSCQLRHAQGITAAPRELLDRIPGVKRLEVPVEAGACCGAPGIYRIAQAAVAEQLGHRQAQAVAQLGADLVVSADPTCIAQLERHLREVGSPLAIHHPIEVLARSIEAGRPGAATGPSLSVEARAGQG